MSKRLDVRNSTPLADHPLLIGVTLVSVVQGVQQVLKPIPIRRPLELLEVVVRIIPPFCGRPPYAFGDFGDFSFSGVRTSGDDSGGDPRPPGASKNTSRPGSRTTTRARPYFRAVAQFFVLCQARELALGQVTPMHVAAYLKQRGGAVATIKQHRAALKMLFDYLGGRPDSGS